MDEYLNPFISDFGGAKKNFNDFLGDTKYLSPEIITLSRKNDNEE